MSRFDMNAVLARQMHDGLNALGEQAALFAAPASSAELDRASTREAAAAHEAAIVKRRPYQIAMPREPYRWNLDGSPAEGVAGAITDAHREHAKAKPAALEAKP